MATIDRGSTEHAPGLLDARGFGPLENGERMDQKTFHERYLKSPEHFRAELIEAIVYVMSSPLEIRHGESDNRLSGLLYLYRTATAGTRSQNNATTIMGGEAEVQPDSALLVLPEFGGQTRDGEDGYTYGAPELFIEVALSSRSIDLHAKLREYERAGVREYVVHAVSGAEVHWFATADGRFEPLGRDPDGLIRSRAFPGLWFDVDAFLRDDDRALIAALNLGLASPEHAAFVAELRRRHEARMSGP